MHLTNINERNFTIPLGGRTILIALWEKLENKDATTSRSHNLIKSLVQSSIVNIISSYDLICIQTSWFYMSLTVMASSVRFLANSPPKNNICQDSTDVYSFQECPFVPSFLIGMINLAFVLFCFVFWSSFGSKATCCLLQQLFHAGGNSMKTFYTLSPWYIILKMEKSRLNYLQKFSH